MHDRGLQVIAQPVLDAEIRKHHFVDRMARQRYRVDAQYRLVTARIRTLHKLAGGDGKAKGSAIPLTERQLKRCAKRSAVGLHRTGSRMDTGSGEIAIAFTTANRISALARKALLPIRMIHENKINHVFRAVAEATEEAILNSMITADAALGQDGCKRPALKDILKAYPAPPGQV